MSAPAMKLDVLPEINTIALALSFFWISSKAEVNSGNSSRPSELTFTFGESILSIATSS
jgi:hypothetical protein